LFGQPSLNSRQSRWLEFLREYDFNIRDIRGKENKVVDALTMRMHGMHDTKISMYQTYFCDRVLEVSKPDLRYMDISVNLQQGMSQ
jgi:hypothetical protein